VKEPIAIGAKVKNVLAPYEGAWHLRSIAISVATAMLSFGGELAILSALWTRACAVPRQHWCMGDVLF